MWLEVWQDDAEAEPTLRSLIEQLDPATVAKLASFEQTGKEL